MDQRKGRPPRKYAKAPQPQSSFGEFEASSLFCPKCRQAVPVRKRLLLILPDGDKYEYLCSYCSSSLGTKMDYAQGEDIKLLV
ncbi:MAG TPA: cytoplasmic protein [Thermodesulfobacteriota bacterium]|nr:cytoplasmic protein [Thermodesulfobacteriota bacterium]